MYKIYRENNYIVVKQENKDNWYYGHAKDVFVDKSNKNRLEYTIKNINDFSEKTLMKISDILKENGTPYTQSEWESFYTENTGFITESGSSDTKSTYLSPIGINSDNVISGGNWSGDTYTGQSELALYNYVGINLQTDEDGTLTILFSQDGVNFSQYPTQEFTVTSGINEVHGAWKGNGRYIKVRFTGDGGRTYFRLQTMYSQEPIILTAPLNQPLSTDQDASVVRAVSIGQDPNNSYTNAREGGYSNAVTSNTPLGSEGVFDSGIIDVEGFTQLWTEISSDVDGTLVGTWYDDATGTNAIRSFTAPYIAIDNLFYSTTVVLGRYLRYTFTNGATAQDRFHIRLKLDSRAYSGQMLKVGAFIPENVLAALTRSVLVGKDTDGVYQNVSVNKGNALLTGDFFSEVALGNINNYFIGTKFGRNPQIDINSAPEDMWAPGGLYTGHPVSFTPQTVNVFSSSTTDTSAGTGARTIQISGLKSPTSTDYETENITLNGTTQVTSINTWWRVNRVKVLTAGTGGQNAGTITVRSTTTTANVFVVMPIGFNQSTIGAYTVPFGKTMIIKRVRVTITRASGAAGSATISLRVRPAGGVYNSARIFELQTGGSTEFESLGGLVIESGSDIKYRIDSVSDNSTIAEGAFEYILINN
jgi:hypothetical protein